MNIEIMNDHGLTILKGTTAITFIETLSFTQVSQWWSFALSTAVGVLTIIHLVKKIKEKK